MVQCSLGPQETASSWDCGPPLSYSHAQLPELADSAMPHMVTFFKAGVVLAQLAMMSCLLVIACVQGCNRGQLNATGPLQPDSPCCNRKTATTVHNMTFSRVAANQLILTPLDECDHTGFMCPNVPPRHSDCPRCLCGCQTPGNMLHSSAATTSNSKPISPRSLS